MLNVGAPGRLVLTFQSMPPFVVECIFALVLAIILAVPLMTRLQLCLDESSKGLAQIPTSNSKRVPNSENNRKNDNVAVLLMNYPTPLLINSASSSNLHFNLEPSDKNLSNLQLNNIDKTHTNDIGIQNTQLQHATEFLTPVINPKKPEITKIKNTEPKEQDPEIDRSSVDFSIFDYKAYRHKLVENSLREKYADFQPPGNVVFNSLYLSNDSVVDMELNNHCQRSFLDFIEENYNEKIEQNAKDATIDIKMKEYLRTFDHFLAKSCRKPETMEKGTESCNIKENTKADRDFFNTENRTNEHTNPVKNGKLLKKSNTWIAPTHSSNTNLTDTKNSVSKTRTSRPSSPEIADKVEVNDNLRPSEVNSQSRSTNKARVSAPTSRPQSFNRSPASSRPRSANTLQAKKGPDEPATVLKHTELTTANPATAKSKEIQDTRVNEKSNKKNEKSNFFRSKTFSQTSKTKGAGAPVSQNRSKQSSIPIFSKADKLCEGDTDSVLKQAHDKISVMVKDQSQSLKPSNTYSPRTIFLKKNQNKNSEITTTKTNVKRDVPKPVVNASRMPSVSCKGGVSDKSYLSKNPKMSSNYPLQDKISYDENSTKSTISNIDSRISSNKSVGNYSSKCCGFIGSNSTNLSSAISINSKPVKDSRTEITTKKSLHGNHNNEDTLKLPRRGSKVSIIMQDALRNYIVRLKQVLTDGDNSDLDRFASLSLKDALLPEMKTFLSTAELEELKNLLRKAEETFQIWRGKTSA